MYEPGAPVLDKGFFAANVPVLGICYGFQLMAQALGGVVSKTSLREFGATDLDVVKNGKLLANTPSKQQVWMSHGDAVTTAPEGFSVIKVLKTKSWQLLTIDV